MAQTVRSEEWPPASPQDVLRLTPKKNKTGQLQQSPLRNFTSPSKASRYQSPDEDDDDSENEEYLRLKLAQIEAKLKLKEFERKKKNKKAESSASEVPPVPDHERRTPPPSTHGHGGKPNVQVPVSPSPRRNLAEKEPPASPSRVLLGIDKGLTGRDISLRRAPGYSISVPPPKPQFTKAAAAALRNATSNSSTASAAAATSDNPFRSNRTASIDSAISSSNSNNSSSVSSGGGGGGVKTFAQRIAEQRAGIKQKEERLKISDKAKSKGWDVPDKKEAEVPKTTTTYSTASSSSSSITSVSSTAVARHGNGGPALKTTRAPGITEQKREAAKPAEKEGASKTSSRSSSQDGDDPGSYDNFSSFHLSKRLIPHATLSRQLSSKALFPIPSLLKSVVGPDFDPPETDGDWVVCGIVCSKSEPRDVAREGAGKYLVTQITDLKWEIELFLFGKAFEKYYRIPKGTVIAILNPNIMKPRVKDTGKFSLTLSDAADSILEIGHARDLGYCKALKKDQKECGSWVDRRHTEFCMFHVELGINKHRSSRMEVATMSKMFSPPKKGQSSRPRRNFLSRGGGAAGKDDGLLPEGPMLDMPQRAGGAGGKVFVASVSTARRIDSDNSNDLFNQGDKAERLRKQLATRERERDVKKRLMALQHNSTGLDYIRSAMEIDDPGSQPSTQTSAFGASHIRSLGFDPTRKPGSTSSSSRATEGTAAVDAFRSSTGGFSAANRSLSPVKSSILKRKQQNEHTRERSLSPPSMNQPPTKKTRQADNTAAPNSVGWGIKAVRDYTSTTLASRHRARSPVRQGLGLRSDVGSAENAVTELKKEAKSVKFAPMPSADSDDDDLEIEGWG